ncbi:hypothetical protein [Falsiroseomonas sp. E2-1-a4]|uniref:hypothetical protein n=1 Tax=Falsiroseomonas sp. E2-1-a4 TaxID=3239299 RepID=UPI003F394281
MHQFPPSDALQFFVGDAIAQVRLDPFSLQFSFEGMRRLVVEHRIEHADPDGTIWAYDCQATERAPVVLQRLLNLRIVAIEREELRLTFRFGNGSTLAVMSELGPYESGHIYAPEIGFTVF